MNQILKDRLIGEIVWAATRQGAFQRSNIYDDQNIISSNDKLNFRNHLKDFCYEELYLKLHANKISEENLIKTIKKLIFETDQKFKPILRNGKFRFGNAQKFVNLYLKFLWLIDRIKEPPHFPVDRLIQKGFKDTKSWTNMNETEYLEVIHYAKKAAKISGQSLANWEAQKYYEIATDLPQRPLI